jgi:tetratricopeptide (TPR) repeat protein/polysaccharide pyruvyl transferase WcaK-like protein
LKGLLQIKGSSTEKRSAPLTETLNLALQYHKAGDFQQAEALYRRALACAPNEPDLLHLLGLLAIQTGNNEQAVSFIRKAIQYNGKPAKFHANLAVALQNLGRDKEAMSACSKALAIEPNNFSAYNTLGNAFWRQGKIDHAVRSFRKALCIKPYTAEIHLNLGKALKEMDKLDEAEECFKRAVALNPNYAEAYLNLGVLYRFRRNLDEAVTNLLKSVENNPGYAEAYNILGNILIEQNKLDAAATCYQKALQTKPHYVEAYYNLGNVLTEQENFDEAISNYSGALAIKPDFAEASCRLGNALLKREKLDEAAKSYQHAASINPDFAEAYNGLGNVLREQGKPEEAIETYCRALLIKPDFAEVHCNISNALFDQGRLDEAIESCYRALAIKPDLAEAHWNMALALLSKGKFKQGWKKYEWRLLKKGASPASFPYPCWDGSSLNRKPLLLYAEQGIGDEIMFASCFQEIIDAAGSCIIECDKRLIPLFSRSFPPAKYIERIVSNNPSLTDVPPADMQIAIGSLPLFFRPSLLSFTQRKAYLIADIRKVNRWRKEFETLGKGLKIGISWRGGKGYVSRIRSIPLCQWSSLFSIPGIHLINLQYGDCTAELEEIKEKLGIIVHHWEDADPLKDLDGFAAKIAALDLVISVDNSTVHLAGALGVPVWTLLPFNCDWRWMRGFQDTPWYPSMRLFRQNTPNDWKEVFEQIHLSLNEPTLTNSVALQEQPAYENSYRMNLAQETLHLKPLKGVALLNDTAHWYHWGCTGTSMAIHQSLSDMGFYISRIPISGVYACKNTPTTIGDFGNPDFFREFAKTNRWVIREIENIDIVVINGEGSLHGNSSNVLNLLYLAYASKIHLGKIVQIINHSCYPENSLHITNTPMWEIYRKVYSVMDFIAVREPVSFDLICRAGLRGTLSFDCLPLYITRNYKYQGERNMKKIVIAGSVAWHHAGTATFPLYIRRMNRLGFEISVLTGASSLPASDDEEFLKMLSHYCPKGWKNVKAESIEIWLDTIARASLLVSGRFHHTIAAAVLGTPFILLESNTPKNSGLAKVLNSPEPLPYDTPDLVMQLLKRTQSILDNPLEPGSNHISLVNTLCELAKKNFTALESIWQHQEPSGSVATDRKRI